MISHKYKCIFIHIPKCAGTSIESVLGHFDSFKGRGKQDHRSIRVIEQPLFLKYIFKSQESFFEVLRRMRYKYLPVSNPKNKITVNPEQYESYFKFTIVRNPWDRAYSWYQNVMRDEIHKKKLGITAVISFNEFLKKYGGKGILKPQTFWIKDFNGLIPLDFIGRFENLEDDWRETCKLMNISEIKLPHEIKGPSRDYREYYDSDSKKIIMKVYNEEINMFGYSFCQ